MKRGVISTVLAVAMVLPMTAAAEAQKQEMILNYSFNSAVIDGIIKDESGHGNDGIIYGNASIEPGRMHFDGLDDYIKMPDALLADCDELTVAINLCPEFDNLHYFTWNFGTSSSEGYMFLNTSRPDGKLRFAITPTGAGGEQAMASEGINKGSWSSVIVTIKDNHGVMYRDGEKVSETDFSMSPRELGATTQNWIGRSPYADALMQAYVEDFRVYNYAISESDAAALAREYEDRLSDELNTAFIKSGIKSSVKEDLTLPKSVGTAKLTWQSSNEAVITSEGRVTRPANGASAQTVRLTASIDENGSISSRSFDITVPSEGGGTYGLEISGKKGADINPNMVGLFFEDINYAADGGLYAEMIENRSFEAMYADNKDFSPRFDGEWAWTAADGSDLSIKSEQPLNNKNPHYLEFDAEHKSFANAAYDGLAMKGGMAYHGSFYAKALGYSGTIKLSAVKDGREYASAELDGLSETWEKYEFDLCPTEDVRGAKLVITLSGSGKADFDMISLIPDDAVDGVFRKDLAEMLRDVRPGFLRFPGGCVVEGYDLDNRYKWKDSIAPVEERTGNWNRWDLHTNGYNHYNQSMGMGFYEFFLLCEYLECDALPVVNVGMACQFQTNETVDIDSAEFTEYIEDALDLIEFANGDADSEWGGKRAAMGHAEPFNLKMIGIGNEQWNTKENEFFKRYEAFEAAIHARYPDIKLIGTSGPDVGSANYRSAWEWIRNKSKNNDNFVYAVDEHYYMTPSWFLQNTDFYDNYDRTVKVFAGEYASRTRNLPNDPTANTLYTALTEAAYFTGLERNSDVVELSCYAPLFARLGYTQWSPDLIWFDDASAYGSPSYYAQKLNSCNLGDYNVSSQITDGSDDNGIFSNVSYDSSRGELIVKIVNTTEEARRVKLDYMHRLVGTAAVVSSIGGGEPDMSNSIDNPTNISDKQELIPVENNALEYNLPQYTFAVIRLRAYTDTQSAEIESGSRGAVLAALARTMPEYDSEITYLCGFDDIASDAWYRNEIGFLRQKGIVEGYDDENFKPDKPISPEEMQLVQDRLSH